MEKFFLALYSFFWMFTCVVFSVSAEAEAAYINKLSEYNIVYLSGEKGIYQYIGNHDGLGLNFSSNEKRVFQIDCVFPQGDNQKYSQYVSHIAKESLPHKNINETVLASNLLRKMNQLRDNKDNESFSYSGFKFEMKLLNNMIHITATEKSAYKYSRVNKQRQ